MEKGDKNSNLFLPLFEKIDAKLQSGRVILAIEGGSASGKTSLSKTLEEIYECTVFHMDDFFLRPEQRTPERFKEIGGNVDRERFLEEVLIPLKDGKPITYRPFDCTTFSLCPPIAVDLKKLIVIEGAYSMHKDLECFYDFSVFLSISPEIQKKRIEKRNTPLLAQRFFNEWIPLENTYFEKTDIKNRCDLTILVSE